MRWWGEWLQVSENPEFKSGQVKKIMNIEQACPTDNI
jgi:hypothetical protein